MTTRYFGAFTPTKLRIRHLGVNISEELNEDLNLQQSEYLVVGEHYTNYGGDIDNSISMIVDTHGFAVNSTLRRRRENSDNYAVEIYGNTYIDGNLIVRGLISNGSNTFALSTDEEDSGTGTGTGGGPSSSIFRYDRENSIYYEGNVTFGNLFDATSNNYAVHIAETANFNINYAQFAIQNRHRSALRVGIIGEAPESPVVFNTVEATPIEFHVGRKQPYFESAYKAALVYPWSTTTQGNTPTYTEPSSCPHLNIDMNGNVGIKTGVNHPIKYALRVPVLSKLDTIVYPEYFLAPDFHVEGTSYSRNMLIYDYEAGMPKNIDEIYVRKMGQTIAASSIIPGEFAVGNFTFTSNLSILGPVDDETVALKVYGDTVLTSNLDVQYDITADNIITHNHGTFNNNVNVQNNIYIKGNVYKEYYNETTGSNEWGKVILGGSVSSNFAPEAFPGNDNGLVTTGRIGVGIVTVTDEINHQAVITKRDTSVFEVELSDKSEINFKRTAFIGHPKVEPSKDMRFNSDGSLVFLTPSSTDTNYNTKYVTNNPEFGQQHIYFYPGWTPKKRISEFILNAKNVPTLGIFTNHRVGINTFSPSHALDVNGDIATSGAYYIKDGLNPPRMLGTWFKSTQPSVTAINRTYTGIHYTDQSAPHVGINTVPRENFGLTVRGKILSENGYYTSEGYQILPFLDAHEMFNKPTPSYQRGYINGRIGIGVVNADSTLNICDSVDRTRLKLTKGALTNSTLLQFNSATTDYSFHMRNATAVSGAYFEIFYGNPLQAALGNMRVRRPFVTRYHIGSDTHQVAINSNVSAFTNVQNDTALLVNGNVEVVGNINVSGSYKVSGSAIMITAGKMDAKYSENLTTNEQNNIYIAGNDVYINPNIPNQSAMYVGWEGANSPDFIMDGSVERATLYVKQPRPTNPFVTKNKSMNEACLTQFNNMNDRKLVFGITNHYDFFVGGDVDEPYIVADANSVGIGGIDQKASRLAVQTTDLLQNTLSLTRYTGAQDVADFVANISLEKIVNASETYAWTIQGPNAAYNQKFQFVYEEPNQPALEVLSITSNGCLGIGTTMPRFAVDILCKNNIGSVRIAQPSPDEGLSQLLIQSHSNEYGTHSSNDYRFVIQNNALILESASLNSYATAPLLHFGSSNTIGVNTVADPEYSLKVDGKMNIAGSLYINGMSFANVMTSVAESIVQSYIPTSSESTGQRAGNVSINRRIKVGADGIVRDTGNVFEVNTNSIPLSDTTTFVENGNLAVFNSGFDKCFIHYRNVNVNVNTAPIDTNIARTGMSNVSFITEFRHKVSADEFYIPDSSDGYVRYSTVTEAEVSGEFVTIKHGYEKHYAENPKIIMNDINTFGCSNEHMYIMTSNLGIGTIEPNAKVHIVNSNECISLTINHTSAIEDIVTISNYSSITKVAINNEGYVGIGTANPIVPLHAIGNVVIDNRDMPLALEVYGSTLISKNIDIYGNGQVRGDLTVHGALVNASDSNLKNDIRKIDDALSKIQKLSGYTFCRINATTRETGVIAQEIESALPEAVFKDQNGMLGVAYGNLVGLLIEGIKELNTKVDILMNL